jgi:phosphoribosyl 1,2-cyclic phosphodiesterase
MRIELLNSSNPPSDLQFLVSFLINDEVAIDAGAIGLLADLQRQQRVRHVFITHEHLDHIATLPIFLENVYEPGPDSVEVLALDEADLLLSCGFEDDIKAIAGELPNICQVFYFSKVLFLVTLYSKCTRAPTLRISSVASWRIA